MADQRPPGDAERPRAGGRGCSWHVFRAVGLVLTAFCAYFFWSGTAGLLVNLGLGTPGKATVVGCRRQHLPCSGDFASDSGIVRRHVSIEGGVRAGTTVRARQIGDQVWREGSPPWEWLAPMIVPSVIAGGILRQVGLGWPFWRFRRGVPMRKRARDLAPVAVVWGVVGSLVYGGYLAMKASFAAAANGDPATNPAVVTILCGVGVFAVAIYVHSRRP